MPDNPLYPNHGRQSHGTMTKFELSFSGAHKVRLTENWDKWLQEEIDKFLIDNGFDARSHVTGYRHKY